MGSREDGIPSYSISSTSSSGKVASDSKGFNRMHSRFDLSPDGSKKLPHMHSNSRAASLPKAYNSMPKSSLANQKQLIFPPSPASSNGRASNKIDRVTSRDKFYGNGESGMPIGLIRGPRVHDKSLPSQSSATKDVFGFSIHKDQYNLPNFQTEYESAKFYVIKSFNEDDIHKSIKYDVWTSTPIGNKKLNAAFHDAEAKSRETGMNCPVFLFFSVNRSGQFVGVAQMIGQVDFKKDMNFWKLDEYNGFFPIKWHIVKDIPSTQFRYITLPNNDNHCVTFSRDTQEIELKQGLQMLKIFKNYLAPTSLLDDYDFYENREKLLLSQKSNKNKAPQPTEYSNGYYHTKTVTGEKRFEMQGGGTKQRMNTTSLINLTGNLSINTSSGK